MLEFQDPSGFLDEDAAVLGFGVGDVLDMSLLNDGEHFRADTHIEQKVGDVLQPAGHLVDIEFALAGTVVAAGDFHFLRHVGHVGDAQSRGHVGQGQGNRHPVDRFSHGTAVENQVGDPGSAQGFGTLLTDHPANGVGNVTFPATVGADDGREPLGEFDFGGVDERFESFQFQVFEVHHDPANGLRLVGVTLNY